MPQVVGNGRKEEVGPGKMNWILQSYEEFLNRYREFWNRRSNRRNILLLSVLYLVRFLLTLPPVSSSGDAVLKWSLLRVWTESGAYPAVAPEHHQGRWALNLPMRFLMEIFGTSHWVYYIFPLLMGLVCLIALYFVAARLKDKSAGATAFLCALLFAFVADECVQFLPMVPATAWILLALLAMFRYLDGGRAFWCLLAGVLLGLGYGCKVTTVYWFVPFGLYLLFYDPAAKTLRRTPRLSAALLLLAVGGLAVFVGEWCFLNHFFGVSHGRFSMLFSGHLGHRVEPQYKDLPEYLLSCFRLVKTTGKYFDITAWNLVLLASVGSAVLLWRKKPREPRMTLALMSFVIVGFLHCYVVYKVFPFLHPERPHARYLIAWIVLGTVLFASSLGEWKKLLERLRPWGAFAAAVLFGSALLVMDLIGIFNPVSNDEHPGTVVRCARLPQRGRPVLLRVKFDEDGDIRKSDRKYARMYRCVYGPSEAVSAAEPEVVLYEDERSRSYLLLWGEAPRDGQAVGATVCKELEIFPAQLVLKRSKKR